MLVHIPDHLIANDLTERLRKGGLSFRGYKGEYQIVRMEDHPELFPEARPEPTMDTQDLSP